MNYISIIFFFNDTATTEIYTLSLHDALPISGESQLRRREVLRPRQGGELGGDAGALHPQEDDYGEHGLTVAIPNEDRKSTRLNSSHANISYAVFCLKKKK